MPASLTGLMLALIAIGAVLSATNARAATANVVAGSLTWGVKSSFVTYIEGPIAGGEVTLSDGLIANENGTFTFPNAAGTADSATGAMDLGFDGAIQFTGHDLGNGPLLDATLSNVRVVVTGTSAVLIADVVSKSLESAEAVEYPDLEVATLNFAGVVPSFANGALTFANVPASLTEDGVPAFADFYPAGTALDAVTITMTLAAPSPTATATTPTATTTTSPTTAPTSTPTTAPTSTPTTVPPSPTTVPQPRVTLSKTVVNPAGDTITVTGVQFYPELVLGTRPPLAGQPAGTYIAFGAFAENWKPSAGAPSSSRPTFAEGGLIWAVPAASRPIVGMDTSVTLNPDGTFTAVIKVKKDYTGALANGRYGIYTYPGSGTTQPLYETFTPITFSESPTTPAPKPPSTGSGLEDGSTNGYTLLVLGAGAIVIAAAAWRVAGTRRKA